MKLESRIWRLGNILVLLMVLLSLRVVYWQLVRGPAMQPIALDPRQASQRSDLKKKSRSVGDVLDVLRGSEDPEQAQDLPQPVVQRTTDLLNKITRGSIYDRNGRLLASDKQDDQGNRFRFYNEPSLAPVIGYVSGLRTGITGLEYTYNEALLGLNRPDVQFGQLVHQPVVGSDLILTVDSNIQRQAEQSLAGKVGSILVMDAHSGAVLALASAPHYDPNRILEPGYVTDLLQNCNDAPDCRGAFLNRATQGLYPPGSTWKTVTLIAGLDTGQISPQTVFDFGKPVNGPNGPYYVYRVDGGVIPDPNHKESKLSLEMSYAKSANAAFARIGDEMPPDTLIDYAGRFGFLAPKGNTFPLEIESSPSVLAQDVDSLYTNNLLRAATAIGQGELLATPIDMGMVVLAVMNRGDLPMPYFVQSVRDPSGYTYRPRQNQVVLRHLMKPGTADLVKGMMATVVQKGSGQRAAVPGLTIGGKTGTAQLGGDLAPHAWFIGYAEDGQRSVVIVVQIENGGEGSLAAAPIFAHMADVAIHQAGEPVQEVVPVPQQAPQAPEPAPQPAVPAPEVNNAQVHVGVEVKGPGACLATPRGPQGSGNFVWPSEFHTLSGGDFSVRHPGIDLASPPGRAVMAADAGVVIFSGWTTAGYGNTVMIDHGNGFITLYGHLSQVSVGCGDAVEAGQIIGLSGNTGNSTGPHLHFEVRVPGGWISPWEVLPPP